MVRIISTRPRLERCLSPLIANSQAQLRIILIRISDGNWAKNSSIKPGGNGVVDGVVVVVVLVAVVVAAGGVVEEVFIRVMIVVGDDDDDDDDDDDS